MKRRTVSITVAVLAVVIIGVSVVLRIQTKADTVPVMSDSVETAQGDIVEEPEQETEQVPPITVEESEQTEETAPVETEQDSTEQVDVAQEETDTEPIDEALTDITALDKTMYATSTVNTRSGPSTDYERVGGLTTNEKVHVIGQSNLTSWFQIDVDGVTQFVSNNYLADAKVEVQPVESSQSSTQTPPPANEGQPNVPSQELLDSLGLPSGFTWDGTISEKHGISDIDVSGINAE